MKRVNERRTLKAVENLLQVHRNKKTEKSSETLIALLCNSFWIKQTSSYDAFVRFFKQHAKQIK